MISNNTSTEPLCALCEEPLSAEEIEYPCDRGDGPICSECECREYHRTCEFCENCEDDRIEPVLFAVLDADGAGVPAGIYRIKERPFYVDAIFDCWFILEAIERIADLPADRQDGVSGAPCTFLCAECAAPYLPVKEASDAK